MRTIASASALLVGLLAAGCGGELVGGGQTPARLLVVSGDLQTAPVGEELAQPLVVRVVDAGNDPVANQLVNFVVTAGGGSVFAGAAITNAQGEARERWTLGPVAGDTQRVEARAVDSSTGAPIVFATFRAVAQAGAAAQLSAESPDRTGTAGAALGTPLIVRVTDANGNGVPGTPVSWTVVSGGGTLQAPATTDAAGQAVATWTLGTVLGTPQLAQAAVDGLGTATFSVMAAPAAALELVQVSGEDQGAGLGQPLKHAIVLQLRGANGGQPVPGAWVHAGAGSSPDSAATDAQGRVSFGWTLPAQQGWYTQHYTVPGTLVADTASAYAAERLPVRITLQSDLPFWFPGAKLQTNVGLLDADGNYISVFPRRATVLAGGGSVEIGAVGNFIWTFGPEDGSVQRVRLEAGDAELVVEKVAHRVWLFPLLEANSVVTDTTRLWVRGSQYQNFDHFGNPLPGLPTMTVTVDGRTTALRTVRMLGLGYWPWGASREWVAGLTPGSKVARFRLEGDNGVFEYDWPFVYQP